jgi:hypothetical protein
VRLRKAALAFDRRLRRGIADAEADELEQLLDRLVANVGAGEANAAPWAGLIDRDR